MASPAKKLKEWLEEAAEKLQESDWAPVAGSIANTSSQTFEYPGGSRVTVSGLGGVEAVPSEVSVTQDGDTFNVTGPSYSQLGMQGYAQPMTNVQRKTEQEENDRIDAEIKKVEAQIEEVKRKGESAVVAWNQELLATMDRHGKEWEAVLRRDGGYDPKKHKGLQARHDAEIEAVWNKEPKEFQKKIDKLNAKLFDLEQSRPVNQQLDASQQVRPNLPYMSGRVKSAVAPIEDPYFQRIFPNEVPTPENDVLDQLVQRYSKYATAKNFIDHYADNFVYGDGKQDQNLTNLMSPSDLQWLTNALAKQKEFSDPRPLDNPQDAVDRVLERGGAPPGILMSIGNGAQIDMDYYKRTGDIKLNKSYVFTEPDDFGARSDSDLKSHILTLGTAGYARTKAGGHPFADASNFIQNPMRFHVVIPGPKKKKKVDESLSYARIVALMKDK